jgi:predicted RNase H-like nuclease (RuvC/YqgF family)
MSVTGAPHPLLHPVVLGIAGLVAWSLFMRQLPLAFLLGVLWAGAVATIAMRQAQHRPIEATPAHDEARLLLRPLRQLHEELESLVAQSQDLTVIKVIGLEALTEATTILRAAEKLAMARNELKRTLRGRGEAEVSIRRLEQRLSVDGAEPEQAALRKAIEAHQAEIGHYVEVERGIATIEGKLSQAQAQLAELKARIAVAAAQARTDAVDSSELGEMVERLRSLGKSLTEAETMMEELR